MIVYWTIRFEAKHHYFKQLATIIGNFINICFSLAERHQLHQCYVQLNTSSLPGEQVELGPGMCLCGISLNLNTL